uniref:Uncharacterized protein n=1 Tax=Rangifer tarandus platyrhynchus TaxID=3082113 RepID=A0ACB0E3M9_RANTA|nr:unnamed protein product [Rangifer tarandus platyrhynchus]
MTPRSNEVPPTRDSGALGAREPHARQPQGPALTGGGSERDGAAAGTVPPKTPGGAAERAAREAPSQGEVAAHPPSPAPHGPLRRVRVGGCPGEGVWRQKRDKGWTYFPRRIRHRNSLSQVKEDDFHPPMTAPCLRRQARTPSFSPTGYQWLDPREFRNPNGPLPRLPGRKMSKPRAVEVAAAAAAVAATAPGPEMVERRGPGRPRTNGENVFTGQSKIYTYMSPNKCSGMRSPLQEENSVAQYEVKCQGKPLAGIYRKRDEKRNSGNAIRSSMKAEEQKIKDARRGPLAPFPNQKSEAAEPPKTPTSSCDTPNAAAAKQALKKPVRGKQAPRKKAQGKTQQNRKLTDFYPVRRSSRKSKAELQSEERKRIDELIESGKEEGMKIDLIDGKGRGVIATKQFSRGEFVVEYHGDLIEITDAKKREALYAQDPSTGCYMYYFQYLSKTYCVDATRETNRLGRLINHSKCGNCQTKLHDIDGVPHLILIASRDIEAGEELLYDYGDRSRASIEAYPWLKH